METFFKHCPSCNCIMEYKQKYSLNYSIKQNKLCRQCSAKNAASIFPDRGWKKLNDDVKSGKKPNGFKDKTHNKDAKLKMSLADKSYTKTINFKKTMSNVTSGKNNGMYGKSFYDSWVDKYGEKIADLKLIEYKAKQSVNSSGKNNGMYGKLSPIGSGNGWSGWYKGWFFRSLLELSYMINVIERFNLEWKNAENKKYTVEYFNDDVCRTYRADFIVEDKYMVEVKPKKLHNSYSVILKMEAAKLWCIKNNFVYKLTSCPKLSDNEILNLIEDKKIILTNRYKTKFDEQFKK